MSRNLLSVTKNIKYFVVFKSKASGKWQDVCVRNCEKEARKEYDYYKKGNSHLEWGIFQIETEVTKIKKLDFE